MTEEQKYNSRSNTITGYVKRTISTLCILLHLSIIWNNPYSYLFRGKSVLWHHAVINHQNQHHQKQHHHHHHHHPTVGFFHHQPIFPWDHCTSLWLPGIPSDPSTACCLSVVGGENGSYTPWKIAPENMPFENWTHPSSAAKIWVLGRVL